MPEEQDYINQFELFLGEECYKKVNNCISIG